MAWASRPASEGACMPLQQEMRDIQTNWYVVTARVAGSVSIFWHIEAIIRLMTFAGV